MSTEIPIAEAYRKSLELFQDPTRFTQHYYQRDRDGKECPWKEGYTFCALGALCFFTDGLQHKATCCLQRVSEHLFSGLHIQAVNDGEGGYEKVQQALRFAIQLWDGREPTEEELGMSVNDLLRKRNG